MSKSHGKNKHYDRLIDEHVFIDVAFPKPTNIVTLVGIVVYFVAPPAG
jgi:hypothetical protein